MTRKWLGTTALVRHTTLSYTIHSASTVVPNLFRAIPPLNVPPPAHSPRGQWLPVGRREALTSKNFYNFSNAVVISCLPGVASFPFRENFPPVGNRGSSTSPELILHALFLSYGIQCVHSIIRASFLGHAMQFSSRVTLILSMVTPHPIAISRLVLSRCHAIFQSTSFCFTASFCHASRLIPSQYHASVTFPSRGDGTPIITLFTLPVYPWLPVA